MGCGSSVGASPTLLSTEDARNLRSKSLRMGLKDTAADKESPESPNATDNRSLHFQNKKSPTADGPIPESQKEAQFFAMLEKGVEQGEDYKPDVVEEEKQKEEMNRRIKRLSARGNAPDLSVVSDSSAPKSQESMEPFKENGEGGNGRANEDEMGGNHDGGDSTRMSREHSVDIEVDTLSKDNIDRIVDDLDNY